MVAAVVASEGRLNMRTLYIVCAVLSLSTFGAVVCFTGTLFFTYLKVHQ